MDNLRRDEFLVTRDWIPAFRLLQEAPLTNEFNNVNIRAINEEYVSQNSGGENGGADSKTGGLGSIGGAALGSHIDIGRAPERTNSQDSNGNGTNSKDGNGKNSKDTNPNPNTNPNISNNFFPTYKLVPKSNSKYSTKRVPSWCDRVLYIDAKKPAFYSDDVEIDKKIKKKLRTQGKFSVKMKHVTSEVNPTPRQFWAREYKPITNCKQLFSDHKPVVLTGVLRARIQLTEAQLIAHSNFEGNLYKSPLIKILDRNKKKFKLDF